MSKEKNIAYEKKKLSEKLSRLAADLGQYLHSLLALIAKRFLTQDTLLTLITVLTEAVRRILNGSPVLPALLRAMLTALPMAVAGVLGEAETSDTTESDPAQTESRKHEAE